jgi:arabinose-5-phosphate isomerase
LSLSFGALFFAFLHQLIFMDFFSIAKSTFDDQLSLLVTSSERICSDLCDTLPLIFSRKGKILTTGIGKSGFVAERLAASLCSIGQISVFLHPVNALHGDLGVVQDGDVMIVFSNSGSTSELEDLILYSKSHGVKIIAFTGRESSPIANLSDAVVLAAFEREGSLFKGPPMVSITAASIFSDALINIIIKQTDFNEAGFARYHPAGQLGKNLLLKAKDIMLRREDLPLFDQNSSLRDLMVELTSSHVGVALFVDADGKLDGMLTDGDIRRILGTSNSALIDDDAYPMVNHGAVTVNEQDAVGKVLTVMEDRDRPLNVVPVVDSESKLQGLIRIHDVLR